MSEDDAGFLGTPSCDEVPALCGACHEEMYEGYKQSMMSAQIESGQRVAVCTTCHMVHGHDIAYVPPQEILTAGPVADITIEDIPLEDVIAELFSAQI